MTLSNVQRILSFQVDSFMYNKKGNVVMLHTLSDEMRIGVIYCSL